MLGDERACGGRIDREVRCPLPQDDRGTGDSGDMRVQRVRGLEERRGTPGAAKGEQQRLEHLVRSVSAEQPLDRLVELLGERGAELVCAAVRIPVERRRSEERRVGKGCRSWWWLS